MTLNLSEEGTTIMFTTAKAVTPVQRKDAYETPSIRDMGSFRTQTKALQRFQAEIIVGKFIPC